MWIIPITHKEETLDCLVSPQDYQYLSQFSWSYINGYARGWVNGKVCLMHRLIIEAEEVDHINHNTLDNRRENLRKSNKSLNALNRKQTKGYYFDKTRNKYRARVKVNGKFHFAGQHDTPEEAHKAYLSKRKELIGW
jgi:hypothetical protein